MVELDRASASESPDQEESPDESGFDRWAKSPLDGGCGLTADEWEAWMLLARGASYLEIASRLSISVLAAHLLVHDVLDKLGVRSHAEAAALVRQLGLLGAVHPELTTGTGPEKRGVNGLDAS